MFNEYKAVIHSAKRGKYTRYLIAYGANPYGVGVPDWMSRVVNELNSMIIKPDPKRVKIKHVLGSKNVEIDISR